MQIDVTSLNKDGGIVFQGTLTPDQAQFILGVGINFLLSQGVSVMGADEDDDDTFEVEGPSTVQ